MSQLPSGVLLSTIPALQNDIPIDLPEYDWDEVMKHNTFKDHWMVVGGNIYQVGEFMAHHPGKTYRHFSGIFSNF